MPIFDGTGWFKVPGQTPRLSDREPFWQRHFWPPSAWGATAIALVVSMIIGFTGALIYVSTEPLKGRSDPAVPRSTRTDATTPAPGPTTTKVEIFSPEALAKKVAASVWTVNTLDEAGRPTTGTAFVAGSAPGQTMLLTSLEVVQASTRQPSPPLTVRNGNTEVKASLWTWQEDIDLALIVLPRSAPTIAWVEDSDPPKPGDKLFAALGSGGLSAGVIGAISPGSIQHNIFTDQERRGAPLLTDRGKVVGMASHAYNPGGAGTDRIFFGVPIRAACGKVLACGSGNLDADTPATSIAPPPGGASPTTPGGRTTSTTPGARTTTTRAATTTRPAATSSTLRR